MLAGCSYSVDFSGLPSAYQLMREYEFGILHLCLLRTLHRDDKMRSLVMEWPVCSVHAPLELLEERQHRSIGVTGLKKVRGGRADELGPLEGREKALGKEHPTR
jgi:hypothetical protein